MSELQSRPIAMARPPSQCTVVSGVSELSVLAKLVAYPAPLNAGAGGDCSTVALTVESVVAVMSICASIAALTSTEGRYASKLAAAVAVAFGCGGAIGPGNGRVGHWVDGVAWATASPLSVIAHDTMANETRMAVGPCRKRKIHDASDIFDDKMCSEFTTVQSRVHAPGCFLHQDL